MPVRSFYIALLLIFASSASADVQLADLKAQLQKAADGQDYVSLEAAAAKILELRPGYPRAEYLQALARARRGDTAGALAGLDELAAQGIHIDLGKPEFAELAKAPGYPALAQRFAALLQPVGRVAPAFRLAEPDFIPEGLAHDPGSGDFFVASVHLRKIVRVHAGKEMPFADRRAGLWSVLGIAVDPARGVLWAVSDALPQMQDYDPKLDGKTELLRFDLGTGKLLARYAPPDTAAHAFGDLCVAPDGGVYVSDAFGGVFWLAPGAEALQRLTPAGALDSAQGLALSADGRHLYISDYPNGLYAYELPAHRLLRLRMPEHVSPYYVDGLKLHAGSLIASQNGAEPQRLVSLKLSQDGLAVTGADVLEASDPRVPEPTLFEVVDGGLYLVANAQWSRFDDKNQLPPKDQLQAPLILKISLP